MLVDPPYRAVGLYENALAALPPAVLNPSAVLPAALWLLLFPLTTEGSMLPPTLVPAVSLCFWCIFLLR